MYISKVDNNNSATRLLVQNSTTNEVEYRTVSSLPGNGYIVYNLYHPGDTGYVIPEMSGEHIYIVDATGSGTFFDIELPDATLSTAKITVKRVNGGSEYVSIIQTTNLIDDSTSVQLMRQYESLTFISDGLTWHII